MRCSRNDQPFVLHLKKNEFRVSRPMRTRKLQTWARKASRARRESASLLLLEEGKDMLRYTGRRKGKVRTLREEGEKGRTTTRY